MAKEVLAIPEEYLADVIAIIRIGLVMGEIGIHSKTERTITITRMLEKWCNEEEEYLKRIKGEE